MIYYDMSDDFGLRSPVIQKTKPFHTKSDTSIIVACVYLTEEKRFFWRFSWRSVALKFSLQTFYRNSQRHESLRPQRKRGGGVRVTPARVTPSHCKKGPQHSPLYTAALVESATAPDKQTHGRVRGAGPA